MCCHAAVMLQVSTNFLSTRPVLQALQDMVDVPLAEEIVHGKHPQENDYLDKEALQQVGQTHSACVHCTTVWRGTLYNTSCTGSREYPHAHAVPTTLTCCDCAHFSCSKGCWRLLPLKD